MTPDIPIDALISAIARGIALKQRVVFQMQILKKD